MSAPQDPDQNPPGWTDPYADPANILGDDPRPPAQPPGSPLLTGLIIGLLLIALSVAVFQLLGPDDTGATADTAPTSVQTETTTTTSAETETTTTAGESGTMATVPITEPYLAVDPPIPIDRMKLITDGVRVNDDDIADIVFGTDAATAIGRFVASFGAPTNDTGWQISTNGFGVCAGDLERILFFGTYAAIVTKPGGQEIFSGYRQDLVFGDLTHDASGLETLSGLRIGDTVESLQEIYKHQTVSFAVDPKLGDVYRVESATSGNLLLWGPVEGENAGDRVVGIYAPDVCNR